MFKNVTSLNPSSGLLKIDDWCFRDNRNLQEFDLSDTNLQEIGGGAFLGCTNLTLSLPNTVTSIDHAFGGVPVVNFPNGINENLTIPENKWGATKITIEGVEYTPNT